jgi:hypothetical protein
MTEVLQYFENIEALREIKEGKTHAEQQDNAE